MNYWLMKSEPDVFSVETLRGRINQRESWDGVRNYQARNYMRDEMKLGDKVLFYHSSCADPGVAGLADVSAEAVPDPTAWDEASDFFDPKSSLGQPRWVMVEIRWRSTFAQVVTLDQLRAEPKLANLRTLKKGNRLSIMPVTAAEYRCIVKMAGE